MKPVSLILICSVYPSIKVCKTRKFPLETEYFYRHPSCNYFELLDTTRGFISRARRGPSLVTTLPQRLFRYRRDVPALEPKYDTQIFRIILSVSFKANKVSDFIILSSN